NRATSPPESTPTLFSAEIEWDADFNANSMANPGADTSLPPWFQSKIGYNLTPAGRQLLEEYSGISASEVEAHIYKIVSVLKIDNISLRDMAWEIFPWPCVGQFWFVSFFLSLHPAYPSVLARFRSSDSTSTPIKFLDLGTGLGQDLRKLAFDGVPVQSLYGSDIAPEYERIGHQLFRDGDRFTGRFIVADFFEEDPEKSGLAKTEGSWDVINIMLILHLFDLPTQIQACRRILKLLSRKPGSMVIGEQTGSTEPREHVLKPPFAAEGEYKTIYQQSDETFIEMWRVVGREAGRELKIEVVYDDQEHRDRYFSGPEQRLLLFTVEVV
ncbi:hypothetical protein MMC31_005667, partial [Peltigera leucophlebia]|nr:hypothetical protein [Peltigera leucophlebia]